MNNKSDYFNFKWITVLVAMQVVLLSSPSFAQDNTISGTVTDANTDETLPGVNVIIKGTTTGTSTDAQGSYSLNVPSLQDTLVFSFVGYERQEIPIQGRETVDVTLQSQAIAGEEMVVIGYGVQEEKDVTGAIESVDMESVSNSAVTGANEALSGRVAGVQVNTTQGIPGGGPQIQIRGNSAVGAGSSPLYVVDGFPLPKSSGQISNPLTQIDPSDIESMSVLKGPSATAIYGSRASNGVIVIETKGGNAGEFQFNVGAYTGWQSIPDQQVTPMMNAREFATFMKESIEDQNRVKGQNEPIPEVYQDPSKYGEGTDWYDVLTRVTPQQNIKLSASGGNDRFTTYLSAGYLRQDGVVMGSNYNQISFRSNIKANVNQRIPRGLPRGKNKESLKT